MNTPDRELIIHRFYYNSAKLIRIIVMFIRLINLVLIFFCSQKRSKQQCPKEHIKRHIQHELSCGFVHQNNPWSDFDMADSECSDEKTT